MTNQATARILNHTAEEGDIASIYLRTLTLIERLHRQLLDVIKDELEREDQTDINAVQALLLFNIGDAELTAGELRSRGHYLGSNVSYNLKKLVEAGYISHARSERDRRSVRVSLTRAGFEIRDKIAGLFDRHLTSLEKVGDVSGDMMDTTNVTLERLERFWADQIRFQL
ncbi:transcriptional regulator LdtR [Parvularcula maris]|uniref:MarR family transcriptional regulator n=1 Tax=Parvularcula maris TaxID=2965077 RepID=A0A9X2LA35_9PROT|nr:MarR family transcriptional regulator [Parvularcula maris]MCQ8185694.1 MarR family transcriptional regulator [Parvularcula maris]